jgi:hypothetical protein
LDLCWLIVEENDELAGVLAKGFQGASYQADLL